MILVNKEETQPIKSKWRIIITAVTFAVLLALIYGLRDQIAEVIRDFGEVNAWVLLLIVPLKFLNYDAYTRLYKSLFDTLGNKVSYWPLYKINLELNFVNQILPSGGISGISYFGLRMRYEGVTAAKATLAQVIKLLLLFISFQPLLIIGLLLLAARGHVNDFVMVVASSIITLLVVGTLMGIYIIESRSRINSFLTFIARVFNVVVHIFRRKHPETINIERAQRVFGELHDDYQIIKKNWRALKMPFVYTMLANLTEIASLYVVYIAFGELVNVGAVILGYAVANFAGLISVLPAGIGIYEGLMTGVLAATGIPASLSIPVTIMFRVITMSLVLVPGYFFYQKAVKSGFKSNGR